MSIEMMGNLTPYMQNAKAIQSQNPGNMDKTRETSSSRQAQQSKATGKSVMDMNDFLKLMAAQLQNQDMNNPISESEMMAQMAQMATVTAMTNMTDVAVTTYSASLVGKEVTLAQVDKEKEGITQLVGKVTGAGLYGGQQIIFVGGKSYSLSQIMAIGTLPDANEKAVWVDEKGEIISKPGKPVQPEKPEEADAGPGGEASGTGDAGSAGSETAGDQTENL